MAGFRRGAGGSGCPQDDGNMCGSAAMINNALGITRSTLEPLGTMRSLSETYNVLSFDLKIQLHVADLLRLFRVLLIGARCIERNVCLGVARLHNPIVDQILFNFFAADVGQHLPVDIDAGRERLPAFGLHFPTKRRILNDVLFRERQIVFREHRPDTGAPAAIGLQVSCDLRRFHFGKLSTRTRTSHLRRRASRKG
jgi:hypothetical protein